MIVRHPASHAGLPDRDVDHSARHWPAVLDVLVPADYDDGDGDDQCCSSFASAV